MHKARWTVWCGCQQVPKQPHHTEVVGSDSFRMSHENHRAKQCLQTRWIQRVWVLHLSDKLPPDPRLFCHDLLISDDCAFMHIKSSREADWKITSEPFTPTELLYNCRNVFQSSHKIKPWMQGMEKNMPGSWSLQFSRCFILPTAFFVLMSENSKIIQSEKSQMSQRYRIIASFFFLYSVGKASFL